MSVFPARVVFGRRPPGNAPSPGPVEFHWQGGEPGLNYLCAGYKKFFTYAAPYLKMIGQLIQSGRPATDIMEMDIRVVPGP